MKKNKLFLLGLFVVCAAVLSLSLVSNTLAKYTTSGTATDTARVANWSVTVTGETYKDDQLEADLATTENEILASASADLLAPGTGIKFAGFTITGQPEVAVKVTYTANLELEGWVVDSAEYMPLVFVIKGDEYSYAGVSAANIDAFEAKIEELIAAYSKTYEENTDLSTVPADKLEVSCYWEYSTSEANDVLDTKLGNQAAAGNAPTVNLTITCSVTQID